MNTATVKVAEASEAKRLEAWVGYPTRTASFDGVIVVRNANTFDFILTSTGDPTATNDALHLSPVVAAPICVVDRTDVVRILADIPERDATIRASRRVLVPSIVAPYHRSHGQGWDRS